MKRVFKIGLTLLLILIISGCSQKYTNIYCDFDMGEFDSNTYKIIKSVEDLNTFKKDGSTELNKKLSYDNDYFKSHYLVLVIFDSYDQNVKYHLDNVEFKDSSLNLKITKSESIVNPPNIENPLNDMMDNNNPSDVLTPEEENPDVTTPEEENPDVTTPEEENPSSNLRINKGYIFEIKNKVKVVKVNMTIA